MGRVLNGTSDFIEADAAHIFATNVAYTVALWAKGVTTSGCVYSEATTASANGCMELFGDTTNGSKLGVFIKSGAGVTQLNSTGTATAFDTGWHHICFAQDTARNYKTYVDGTQDLSAQYATGTVSPTNLVMGAFIRTTTTNFYGGTLAHVATWSRQLSATEIMSLALGIPPSYLTADHYWPLAGTASPEPDTGTASPTNGTLTGTTSAAGPPIVGLATFDPSLGRRPVPMIQGPDKDKLLGMKGNSY